MITFNTSDPAALLRLFDAAIIKGHAKGGITTWQKIGGDYTHAAPQWAQKAYFEPHIALGKLNFNIVKNKSTNVTALVYAYYHGHLLETFLNHFDVNFTNAISTALPVAGDLCSATAA